MVYGNCFGQKNTQKTQVRELFIVKNISIGFPEKENSGTSSTVYKSFRAPLLITAITTHSFSFRSPIPADLYLKCLGFICTKELQLDRLTTVPIRFRLGSLEYVNWMEKKPNANRGF
jgi:hypothetical protein